MEGHECEPIHWNQHAPTQPPNEAYSVDFPGRGLWLVEKSFIAGPSRPPSSPDPTSTQGRSYSNLEGSQFATCIAEPAAAAAAEGSVQLPTGQFYTKRQLPTKCEILVGDLFPIGCEMTSAMYG